MPPEPVPAELVTDDAPSALAPYQFLEVNGFIYRGNRVTGEMWRLEAHATEKKTQVWRKIEDLSGTTH